jgi:hypothetical protein
MVMRLHRRRASSSRSPVRAPLSAEADPIGQKNRGLTPEIRGLKKGRHYREGPFRVNSIFSSMRAWGAAPLWDALGNASREAEYPPRAAQQKSRASGDGFLELRLSANAHLSNSSSVLCLR